MGARLHQADLAVNKVLAAASRTKARDFVDLVCIEELMCPLGSLVMAAAGKPPHFSPQKIIDEVGRRGLSVSSEVYDSVRSIPENWNAAHVRELLSAALNRAEAYLKSAPADIVGVLAVDSDGTPVEVVSLEDIARRGIELRRATEEPEVMPNPADAPATGRARKPEKAHSSQLRSSAITEALILICRLICCTSSMPSFCDERIKQ